MQPPNTTCRQRWEVQGIVQGVGFRPFVYGLATELGLSGFVLNHSAGVTLEVEGEREQLAAFGDQFESSAPPLAHLDSIQVSGIPVTGDHDFRIIASMSVSDVSTPVSPDIATCDTCTQEMQTRADRRFRYPFINCTNCGPRYTIVRDIPYDRPLTTMSQFPMCSACQHEYEDPANRRYHAQPNACPACGPVIWFVRGANAGDHGAFQEPRGPSAEQAITAFHQAMEDDAIVATKGIGGFHLACAANSSPAIQKLRQRKGRVDKPLAIMVADLEMARRLATLDASEAHLLNSHQRPIVLLRRRPGAELSELLAPGNDYIGIMLPYSPLHALLVERQPLVMTSGNIRDEPIVRTNVEARERLAPLADAFLLHNRDIHVACDDSVVRILDGHELPIRRSRGYSPLPIRLPGTVPSVLAVGGELKATFCLTKDECAYMGPHIGDMGNLETLIAFERAVDHFRTLFRIEPEFVACDLHPGYLSSQWAREYARDNGQRLIEVQHHHAHIASVLAEHSFDFTTPVIGISFDGTGYGTDGAIWGGEVLIASCRDYQRFAHLKYVPLPGGDASVKHPYRAALAHLWSAGLPWEDELSCVSGCPEHERMLLRRQLERNLNCVPTSSMGRLFDAVAALIGVRTSVTYEAQAAIEMEALAADLDGAEPYPFSVSDDKPRQIDPAPLLAGIIEDVLQNTPRATIIGRFHGTIVAMIADLSVRVRDEYGIHHVALSGGVFQNVLLLRHAQHALTKRGFDVLTHRIVPPNDGGLALGQAMVVAARQASDQPPVD